MKSYLDPFYKTVHSNLEYPENKDWVESSAAAIEASLQEYLERTDGAVNVPGCGN